VLAAWPRDVAWAVDQAVGRGFARDLASAYAKLPDTICAREGHCCGLLPPVHPIEALCWLGRLADQRADRRAAELAKLTEHFLTNAVQRRPCPWREENACRVYEQRFFGCRAHGLWSAGHYARRHRAAAGNQARIAAAWAGLGVKLPNEVLAAGPGYCGNVRPISGAAAPSDADIEALESRIQALGRGMTMPEAVWQWGGDISFAAAWLTLGPRLALERKVAATRAALAGLHQQFAEIIDQSRQAAREMAC